MERQRRPFKLGDIEINPDTNHVGGQHIDHKSMAVLLCLAKEHGKPISIQDLLDRVWADVVVNDNVVHQAVATLRRALHDDSHHPRFIETQTKRGYRLLIAPADIAVTSATRLGVRIAVVLSIAAIIVFASLHYWQRSESSVPVLALLPIQDLSDGQHDPRTVERLVAELGVELGSLSGLQLIGRTTMLHMVGQSTDPRDMLREWGVTHMVAGDLIRSDRGARLLMRVTSTESGTQLWSQDFSLTTDGLVDGQLRLSGAIADAVGAKVGEDDRVRMDMLLSSNESARRLYYDAAVSLRRRGNPEIALELLERALEYDPDFLAAWSLKAITYLVYAEFGWGNTAQYWQLAHDTAKIALDKHERLPRAHLVLGGYYAEMELDLAKALASFDRAEVLGASPGMLAVFRQDVYMNAGRYHRCAEVVKQAIARDPLNGDLHVYLGRCLGRMGRLDEAVDLFSKALSLEPNNANYYGNIYVEYLAVHKRVDLAREVMQPTPTAPWAKAMIQWHEGNPAPLRNLVDSWVEFRDREFMRADTISWNYFRLADYEKHLDWFQRSVEERANLVGTKIRLDLLPNYWVELETWADTDPDRVDRLASHRRTIDRITSRLVL